jgi:hypothetical protein
MSVFSDAVQSVLTQGLDAAKTVALARLQVNDPTPYVTGPNGQRVAVGQMGGIAGAVSSIPPVVWIAGLLVVGAVVVLPLLRR